MKVKKVLVIAAIIICVVIIIITLFTIYLLNSNAIDNINPIAKSFMLKTTLEWGRLAPIPKSRTEFNIKTEGGPFTRSFRSSFYLPKTDLEKWIAASPGLADAEIENINDSKQKYIIKPGGGAQYGEAVIDFEKSFIEIYVYWS
ncbi:MAG: hypothetical protein FIA99_00960 [Ruminiclostridium sp.]|nr:hypothetical protein [Ruminiclostridium sp.]